MKSVAAARTVRVFSIAVQCTLTVFSFSSLLWYGGRVVCGRMAVFALKLQSIIYHITQCTVVGDDIAN